MAEFTEALTDGHDEMIGKQPILFVSTTAPERNHFMTSSV
jgi:hypothetical protein